MARRSGKIRSYFGVRSAAGVYIVEVLVALLVGSMMLLALASLFLETLHVTTATSNQMIADQIGHTILEYARAAQSGSGNLPNGPLCINSDGSVALTAPQQEALGIDQTNNYTWTASTISGEFKGTATAAVTPGSVSGTTYSLITVTVTWTDQVHLLTHSSSYSTVVVQPSTAGGPSGENTSWN
jgi:Tfp pilus assembly protein PilV